MRNLKGKRSERFETQVVQEVAKEKYELDNYVVMRKMEVDRQSVR